MGFIDFYIIAFEFYFYHISFMVVTFGHGPLTFTLVLHMSTLTYQLFDHLALPISPINLVLCFVFFLFLLLGLFIYTFQSKLIYIPQLPPGSREQVWLPSRFGYGPGRTIKRNLRSSKDHDSEDDENENDNSIDYKWEEVEIVTKDKVKLQAYWIKAPSKWNQQNEKEQTNISNLNKEKESDPYTVLYMQANAGNIVSLFCYFKYQLTFFYCCCLGPSFTNCKKITRSF